MRVLKDAPELLSLNTATLGHRLPIEQVIDLVAAKGFGNIVPWRRDLERKSVGAIARQCRDAGLKVNGYCRSTYFPQATAEARKLALQENVYALEDAATLGADVFTLVVGSLPSNSRDLAGARQQVKDGVSELLETAKKVGVRLALEPLHPMTAGDRSCLNTVSQALNWAAEIDPDTCGYLGVAVDVYHVWWDENLEADIARAGREDRLYAFHVCDWLVPTVDLVTDRGMMGDGVIDLKQIRSWVEGAGYTGPVEVEIFSSNNWWQQPEEVVLETCIRRLATVC
ncbi:sugar phosphate isomerase/epimerase [Rhodobacteraceae bacterium RKSG542]|uniref:sugar phosphate isomerase/epimerase family protein n=1 Tax=Pseudovibrio flavus TaxID=2529854 RepID=UPI0012BC9752|nr:sugar phosphate isomerase/epimerase family protein [Pseudovibrio flavus]MTI15989.1 sugar phosphate isomerase/epimerase [Pseudovibrio flavus]